MLKYPFWSAAACHRFSIVPMPMLNRRRPKRRQAAALHIETDYINGILVISNSLSTCVKSRSTSSPFHLDALFVALRLGWREFDLLSHA